MNEMKRRVAGILEFVSRTQNELDREVRTPPGSGGSSSSTKSALRETVIHGSHGLDERGDMNGGAEGRELFQSVINGLAGPFMTDGMDEKQFSNLSSMEMMAVLRGQLVIWQREFGVWGEK
jgi:hypothetical protein